MRLIRHISPFEPTVISTGSQSEMCMRSPQNKRIAPSPPFPYLLLFVRQSAKRFNNGQSSSYGLRKTQQGLRSTTVSGNPVAQHSTYSQEDTILATKSHNVVRAGTVPASVISHASSAKRCSGKVFSHGYVPLFRRSRLDPGPRNYDVCFIGDVARTRRGILAACCELQRAVSG